MKTGNMMANQKTDRYYLSSSIQQYRKLNVINMAVFVTITITWAISQINFKL